MSSRPKIVGRATSLAHAFVHAIIPRHIDEMERQRLYKEAGLNPNECAYCGASATDADHFRGLVKGGKPSGYFHTPDNLVPSCGPCNQSKSGAEWRKWMTGRAKGSPNTRNVSDPPARIERLAAFERLSTSVAGSMSDIREHVGPDLWDAYWARLSAIRKALEAADLEAETIRVRWEAAPHN